MKNKSQQFSHKYLPYFYPREIIYRVRNVVRNRPRATVLNKRALCSVFFHFCANRLNWMHTGRRILYLSDTVTYVQCKVSLHGVKSFLTICVWLFQAHKNGTE